MGLQWITAPFIYIVIYWGSSDHNPISSMGKSYEPTDGRQAAVELNRTLEAARCFFSEGFDRKPIGISKRELFFFLKTVGKTWDLGGVMVYDVLCNDVFPDSLIQSNDCFNFLGVNCGLSSSFMIQK